MHGRRRGTLPDVSAHRLTTRRQRPGARVAGGLLVMASLASGCTTSADVNPPGLVSGSASVPPGPAPTLIEEASQCVITTDLNPDDPAALAIGNVFLGSSGVGSSDPVEQRPGPDADDASRCPGDLPDDSFCDRDVPWTGLPLSTLVTASGATRVIDQEVTVIPFDAAADQDGVTRNGQTLTYRQFDLTPGDPKGLVAYLERAFTKCAHAKPTAVNGFAAMAGRTPAESSFSDPMQYVLLVTDQRVAWVTLAGVAWKRAETTYALRVTDHLRAAKPA